MGFFRDILNNGLLGPLIFFSLGSLFTIIGTIWLALDSNKLQKNLENNISSISQITNSNQKINSEILSRQTGGSSFPTSNINFYRGQNLAVISVHLVGKFPLENLQVSISKLGDFRKLSGLSMANTSLAATFITEGDLKKDNFFNLGNIEFDNSDHQGINLYYETLHNKWYQYIRLIKGKNGEWLRAWINYDENGVILRRHMDKGFPNKDGEILIVKDIYK